MTSATVCIPPLLPTANGARYNQRVEFLEHGRDYSCNGVNSCKPQRA